MSEQAPDRIWSGIDVPKTIAGVLAAVTAAVIGSFLGAAGTLAGAALASIVGSVGTEIYRQLVHRGQRKIVATFVTAPAAVGTPAVAAAADESPSQPEPVPEDAPTGPPPASRQLRWGRVAVVAASVFVLAVGVLSAFELISGKSASDAVRGGHGGARSTVGSIFDRKSNNRHTTPVTTPSSSTPSEEPSTSETPGPPTTSPSPAQTGSGSAPSAPPATSETTAPGPTSTDTQNSNGSAGNQNNIAPPTAPPPQGTAPQPQATE
jgi:hypothetical protein